LASSRTLQYASQPIRPDTDDIHIQFCSLAGVPPSNLPDNARRPVIARRSLYGRAVHRRNAQNRWYLLTASLSNTLLLSQVVLGAALTGLGASGSSHILITVFGALNTIIAGVVAYLKSRGQPMRARMFRDDLDRVVDEIENSEVMWLGIQSGVHGYDEIAIDDSISVRSEVARLTRLYDKVVKNNTMNDRKLTLRFLHSDMLKPRSRHVFECCHGWRKCCSSCSSWTATSTSQCGYTISSSCHQHCRSISTNRSSSPTCCNA
jgi:hypothetical protein